MGKAEDILTYGVWLGDEPMPEHAFDEVVTEIQPPLQRLLVGANTPKGADGWRVVSDIVRLWEGIRRPGWVYHDFDCQWKGGGFKPNGCTLFSSWGSLMDIYCFYVGADGVLQRLIDAIVRRRTKEYGLLLGRDTVYSILNKIMRASDRLLPKGAYAHGNIL